VILPRLFVVTALAVVGATATLAHEGATGVAKERMDLMQSMSKNMKEISRRINANRDLAAIGAAATRIHDTSQQIPSLFPADSGTGITDAKPEIWQHWDEFQDKVRKLGETSAALASLGSSGDVQTVAAQFKEVIHACTSCHGEFRRGKADRL